MFKTRGYLESSQILCASGEVVDLATLSPFLRTLLVTDGTVTKTLEAWFWEKVVIETTSIVEEAIDESIPALGAQQGDRLMQREVKLCGVTTGRVYVVAQSWLWLDRLEEDLADGLRQGRIGIGELLREQNVETYREIIGIDHFSSALPDTLSQHALALPVISRAYCIRVAGSPAFLVTEYFPLCHYGMPLAGSNALTSV